MSDAVANPLRKKAPSWEGLGVGLRYGALFTITVPKVPSSTLWGFQYFVWLGKTTPYWA